MLSVEAGVIPLWFMSVIVCMFHSRMQRFALLLTDCLKCKSQFSSVCYSLWQWWEHGECTSCMLQRNQNWENSDPSWWRWWEAGWSHNFFNFTFSLLMNKFSYLVLIFDSLLIDFLSIWTAYLWKTSKRYFWTPCSASRSSSSHRWDLFVWLLSHMLVHWSSSLAWEYLSSTNPLLEEYDHFINSVSCNFRVLIA